MDFPKATNSSMAKEARSNRDGQAKFHIGRYKSRLVNGDQLTRSWICLASVEIDLGGALILGDTYL